MESTEGHYIKPMSYPLLNTELCKIPQLFKLYFEPVADQLEGLLQTSLQSSFEWNEQIMGNPLELEKFKSTDWERYGTQEMWKSLGALKLTRIAEDEFLDFTISKV